MIDFIILNKNSDELEQDYKSLGFSVTKKNEYITIVEYPGSANKIIISSNSKEDSTDLSNLSNQPFLINNLEQTIYLNLDNSLIRKEEYTNWLGYKHQIVERKIVSNQDLYDVYVHSYERIKEFLKVDYELVPGATKKYIAEWLNHLLEFEINSMNSIKTCIAESGKSLKVNLQDADAWKKNLNYSEMSIPLSINFFLIMREYNSHFLEVDKFDNYCIAQDKKLYLKDIIHNVTSHTLEHLTDLENKLEELKCYIH